MDINTCYETTNYYHTIAAYSHLVPVALGLFLSGYALVQAKFSKLSIVFFSFVFGFSLWLIGDLIVWTFEDYDTVYFFWSWLDFVNIIFYALGAYFFGLIARGKVSLWEKALYVLMVLPAFVVTVMGQSIVDFYHPVCEATSHTWLTEYKLYAEGVAAFLILLSVWLAWKPADTRKRTQISIVAAAILLFYVVFAQTEYVATTTGVYEINLYGLFILPLFLIIMTFAITDLRLFNFRFVGTQILSYILIIMVGSQLLYVRDPADQTLSLITLAITLFLGVLLLENSKREAEARIEIEELAGKLSVANDKLKELDRLKDEFLSIASHQLRAPMAAIRGTAANIADGEYGVIPENLKEPLGNIQETSRLMVNSIEDYLNISRIEQGRMKYEMGDVDLADLAKKVKLDLEPVAKRRGLTLTTNVPSALPLKADIGKLKQVVTNLVDNAIKYTQKGGVTIAVEKADRTARLIVSDTGVGIDPKEIKGLFEKFTRARDANKVNTTGTGLGLYVAKQLVEGHRGTIRAESDGPGKGTRFIVELPL